MGPVDLRQHVIIGHQKSQTGLAAELAHRRKKEANDVNAME